MKKVLIIINYLFIVKIIAQDLSIDDSNLNLSNISSVSNMDSNFQQQFNNDFNTLDIKNSQDNKNDSLGLFPLLKEEDENINNIQGQNDYSFEGQSQIPSNINYSQMVVSRRNKKRVINNQFGFNQYGQNEYNYSNSLDDNINYNNDIENNNLNDNNNNEYYSNLNSYNSNALLKNNLNLSIKNNNSPNINNNNLQIQNNNIKNSSNINSEISTIQKNNNYQNFKYKNNNLLQDRKSKLQVIISNKNKK